MKHFREKEGLGCMALGILLLAAALALLLHNLWEEQNAGNAAAERLKALRQEIAGSLAEDTGQTGGLPELEGDGYIGYLSIPALELELPVMDTWDDGRLKTAPCRYSGSVQGEDLVICGHSYRKHFGGLHELVVGDRVYFTGADGTVTAYQVKKMEILKPGEIRRMTESGYALTLYTCTWGGAARVTVRCRRLWNR